MRLLDRLLARIGRDTGGVTLIEYGLLAGLIAIAMVVGLTAFGNALINVMTLCAAQLATAK